MLTQAQNDRLSRVGPGSPCGELMRRYWHPVAAAAQMKDKFTMQVRLLGEDLILYKYRGGVYLSMRTERPIGPRYAGTLTRQGAATKYSPILNARGYASPLEGGPAPENRGDLIAASRMATADTVLDQISSGAPLGLAWPDIIPFNSLGTCVPRITVDNEVARDAGITDARLAQPRTPADFDKVEENRKVAIDGMKAGLQSGQKLPYP